MALAKSNQEKTLADWLNLPGDQRGDLIDGQIYLQASPSPQHSLVQSQMVSALSPLRAKFKSEQGGKGVFENGGWVFGTEIGVIYSGNACTHDIAGWRSDRLPRLPDEGYISVFPDWVCEIVSQDQKRDMIYKRNLLERNRVQHYWLIFPKEKSLIVLALQENRYDIAGEYSGLEAGTLFIPPFEGHGIDLAEVFPF
jgi:Uma2 family endonuclease